MRDARNTPLVSPDGRFEVIVDETPDRFETLYDTVLVERATGKRLFQCEGAPPAEFSPDGVLTVDIPGYRPNGVQVDPTRRLFRTYPSGPWVPAEAWGIVEAAFKRGWSHGVTYKQESQPTPFPWVSLLLLLGSILALPVLAAQSIFPVVMLATLMGVAALGFFFFGWLAAHDVRVWIQERRWARAPEHVRRPTRPR
jgi:hypothetical protein